MCSLPYYRLASAGPIAGISAVLAYETQSAAIAASKVAGLREHYGMDGRDVAFWDVHAGLDLEWDDGAGSLLAEIPEGTVAVATKSPTCPDGRHSKSFNGFRKPRAATPGVVYVPLMIASSCGVTRARIVAA